MDVNIINGVVRALGPALVAYLAGKGILPAGDYSAVWAALAGLIGAVWSIKSNVTVK